MNNKKLATYCDYNKNDLTSTGADWTLYADGRISADTRSRWQGSRDGERWIAWGAVKVEELGDDVDDNDAESALVAWVGAHKWDSAEDFMDRVRAGHVVG